MKLGILFAIAAVFFYAVENVVIEQKLARVSPLANIVFFNVGMLALAIPLLLFQCHFDSKFVMPRESQLWAVAFCGILLFFADFCFFSAYNSGASLIAVTTIVVTFPVFASLIKFVIGGGFPSATQLLGWALAVASVILVSKK